MPCGTHCTLLLLPPIRWANRCPRWKQVDHAKLCRMYHQMFLNLMGKSRKPTLLKGEAFDCDVFVSTSGVLNGALHYIQFELLFFCGEWKRAAKMALQKRKGAVSGSVAFMFQTCHRGLALYAMAHRTGKWRYKSHACQIRKTVEGWMKMGNPNVQHYHNLLCAEQAALDGKNQSAEALYKGAIQLAARAGHLNDAGLFNERYAAFLLRSNPKSALAEDEAKYRIEQAIHFYKEWEAVAKVEMLEDNLRMGLLSLDL